MPKPMVKTEAELWLQKNCLKSNETIENQKSLEDQLEILLNYKKWDNITSILKSEHEKEQMAKKTTIFINKTKVFI